MSWNILLFDVREEETPPGQVQSVIERFGELTSRLSEAEGVHRYEWGKMLADDNIYSHCLLVTLDGPIDPRDVYGDHLRSARYEEVPTVHDATPSARGATRGQLRRLERLRVNKGDSEKAGKLEEVLADLPSKVTAIERLQWGIVPERGPATEISKWYVLLTFADEAARDAYLADPAYKEYEELSGGIHAQEYIATDRWSF